MFAVDRMNSLNNMQSASKECSVDFRISESEPIDYDFELTQHSNTFSSAEISDQNERVVKELSKAKLTKMLKKFTSNQSKCLLQQNYCDQSIDKSPSIVFNMENSCNASDNKIATRSSTKKYDRELSFKLNIENNSQGMSTSSSTDFKVIEAIKMPIQRREQSPDLFDDFLNSDDETNNENVDDSTSNFPESADTSKSKTNDWEKTLLKRLQTSLSSVLPPPSKTIIQYSITELVDLYNDNLNKMSECREATESLFKPTHTVEEVKKMVWEDITWDVKCHGLLFNRTTNSEDIELLCMKYAERCVGVETSSSFTHDCRPSVNKARMKLLTQSPGTRLSHLAGRKRGLSSANLMSKQCGSDSSKLGSKQLVIDVQ